MDSTGTSRGTGFRRGPSRRGGERLFVLLLGVLALLVVLEVGLRAVGSGYLLALRLRQPEAGGEGEKVVLCLGESTTAVGGMDAWPAQLKGLLELDLGGEWRVINAGIPGGDSAAILDTLPDLLRRWRPDVVVAMMGANDEPATSALPPLLCGPWAFLGSLKTVALVRQAFHDLRGAGAAVGRGAPGLELPPRASTGAGIMHDFRAPPVHIVPVGVGQRPTRCEILSALVGEEGDDRGTPPGAGGGCQAAELLVGDFAEKGRDGLDDQAAFDLIIDASIALGLPGGRESLARILDEALTLGPHTAAFLADLGTLLGERGSPYLAGELAERALALDGNDPAALILMARCRRDAGDLVGARRHLELAVAGAPESFAGQLMLAEVAFAMDDHMAAEEAWHHAAELVPDEASAHTALGRLAEGLGWELDAWREFHRASGLDADDPEPLYRAARVAQALGRPEEAERNLRDALARGGGCASGRALIELLVQTGRAGEVEVLLATLGGPSGLATRLPCLLGAAADFYEAQGALEIGAAYRARDAFPSPVTAVFYAKLKRGLDELGVPLVLVQYPTQDLEALRRFFPADTDVVFVDNGPCFREAVLRDGYFAIF